MQTSTDPVGLGVANGYELLRNDRQHLNVNAVELVKAAPRSRLSQTREEPSHHLHTNTTISATL